jgi:hypothetical protein
VTNGETLEDTIRRVLRELIADMAAPLPETGYRTEINLQIRTTDPEYPHHVWLGQPSGVPPGEKVPPGCCDICHPGKPGAGASTGEDGKPEADKTDGGKAETGETEAGKGTAGATTVDPPTAGSHESSGGAGGGTGAA